MQQDLRPPSTNGVSLDTISWCQSGPCVVLNLGERIPCSALGDVQEYDDRIKLPLLSLSHSRAHEAWLKCCIAGSRLEENKVRRPGYQGRSWHLVSYKKDVLACLGRKRAEY